MFENNFPGIYANFVYNSMYTLRCVRQPKRTKVRSKIIWQKEYVYITTMTKTERRKNEKRVCCRVDNGKTAGEVRMATSWFLSQTSRIRETRNGVTRNAAFKEDSGRSLSRRWEISQAHPVTVW